MFKIIIVLVNIGLRGRVLVVVVEVKEGILIFYSRFVLVGVGFRMIKESCIKYFMD